MRKRGIDRLAVAAFCLFFLCTGLPSGILFSLGATNALRTQIANHALQRQRQAERIEREMVDQFSRMEETAIDLLHARWLTRLSNHIRLYDEEFDLPRRKEIMQGMTSQMGTLHFVKEVIVVVPQKKLAITPSGWFALEDLHGYYPYLTIGDGVATSSDANLLPLVTHHTTLSDNFVCVLVDVTKLRLFTHNSIGNSFLGYTLTRNGQTLSQQAALPDEEGTLRLSVELPSSFALQLTYLPYRMVPFMGNTPYLAAIGGVLLLLAALISARLAQATTGPLRQAFTRLAATRSATPSQQLRKLPGIIDTIVTDNEHLSKQLQEYEHRMQDDAVYRLLTDVHACSHVDEAVLELFPWWHEGLPYVVLIATMEETCGTMPAEVLEAVLTEAGYKHYTLRLPNADLACVIWLEQGEAFAPDNWFSKWMAQGLRTAISGTEIDMTSLPAAYLAARHKLETQEDSPHTSYRLTADEEMLWLKTAREGDETALASMARRLLTQHGMAFAPALFAPVPGKPMQKCTTTDETVSLLTCALCDAREALSSQDSAASNLTQQIKAYIDDNFHDSSLSLKHLSDLFHVSTSLFSRMIKVELGVTFGTYLLQVRLRHAKRLLCETTRSLTEIANGVGYENYLSFKRAFIREEGISPRDFRKGLDL